MSRDLSLDIFPYFPIRVLLDRAMLSFELKPCFSDYRQLVIFKLKDSFRNLTMVTFFVLWKTLPTPAVQYPFSLKNWGMETVPGRVFEYRMYYSEHQYFGDKGRSKKRLLKVRKPGTGKTPY